MAAVTDAVSAARLPTESRNAPSDETLDDVKAVLEDFYAGARARAESRHARISSLVDDVIRERTQRGAAADPDLAELEARITEAAGERDDYDRAKSRFFDISSRTAAWCAVCARDFGPADAVYRRRVSRGRGFFGGERMTKLPVCEDCAGGSTWWCYRGECEACGRPVADTNYRRVVTCCEDHYAAAVAGRRRQKAAEARQLTCESCDARFIGARRDARYCSSACRQKAYRARVTAAVSRPEDAPGSRNDPSGADLRDEVTP